MTANAPTDRHQALQSFLQMRRGNSTPIETFRRIATGNSRSNWFVRMDDGDRYVVRVEQGGVFGTSSAEEFAFMGAAQRLGVEKRTEPGQDAVVTQHLDAMDHVLFRQSELLAKGSEGMRHKRQIILKAVDQLPVEVREVLCHAAAPRRERSAPRRKHRSWASGAWRAG